jgi:hypothetical protein
MRVFARELGKYCTVVSTKQLREAQAAGIPEAKITVELHMNIHEQKTKPFYKTVGKAEVKYGELKF